MTDADGLDGHRIKALALPMLTAIRENYLRGPQSRDRCYEALNALAFCAASVVAGAGDRKERREARAWFDRALAMQVADLARNPPSG